MEENNNKTLNKFDYYAFISYSTADEKWAKWLHKHLESYSLPSALRRSNNSLPKYIRPVFWYKTDLSGTELHSALEKELTSSRHLVLICSPESAKSVWVNDEVKSFVESNRTDYIIPFIVSGQPDNPEGRDYCYPQVLKDMPRTKMLRGIDVSKVGKQHALIDVVSTMFGLRFDALWQRHKRAQIRRNICYVLFVLILVLAGIGIWDYNRSIYEYYADYVDVYGIPQGICKLTDDQKNHRLESFRFEYRRIPYGEPNAYSWRLYSVANVNSLDKLQEYESVMADRFALQIYFYNKTTGKLAHVENYNHFGTLQCRYQYSKRDGVEACIVDIEGGDKDRTLGFSSLSSTSRTAEENKTSNVTRFIFLRDSLGHVIRKTFHSNNDYVLDRSITADNDGVFGQSYKLDSLGRIVEIKLLNKEMQPFQTSSGFSRITFDYDNFSNIKACSYYNSNNCLTPSPNGWAKFEDFSDQYGNCIEERTYGSDMKLWKHEGAEIQKWEYDSRGFLIKSSFFDSEGNLCMNDCQYSVSEHKYDDNGNNIELRYFDAHEKLVMAFDEYSIIKMSYDDNGNKISFSAYDINNRPCYVKEGYSSWVTDYNAHNPIEQIFFGIDGNPCLTQEGYSKVVNVWNDQNQLVEEKFYGTDGKPCLKEGGLSVVKYAYDERGNKCEESYYGTKGEPIVCKTNYHRKRTIFNDRGDILENCFYDIHDKPCMMEFGYAYRCYTYDRKGNLTTTEYFDSNRKPCLSEDGIHIEKREYDDRGNIIKYSYCNEKGKYVTSMYGSPIILMEYDENNRQTKYSYLDEKEKLFFNKKNGFAMAKTEYNKNGLKIKESYYNEKGELSLCNDDHAIEEYKYDSRYNVIETDYYDETGKLGAKDGIAIIKNRYDSRSNKIEVAYYDKNRELCNDGAGASIYKYTYNEKGLETSMTSYGPDKTPKLNKVGFCKYRLSYDERGNIIERKFYNEKGQPCLRNEGNAVVIYKYDNRDYLIQKEFYDTNMKPVNLKDGYSIILYSYADNYNTRITRYYDVNGKLVKEEKD